MEKSDRVTGRLHSAPEHLHNKKVSVTKQKIKVLVVDDHPVVREGLVAVINRQSDMSVVAEAQNGQQSVDLFFTQRPDVCLLDLRMPVEISERDWKVFRELRPVALGRLCDQILAEAKRTIERPGKSADFQLAVKRGHDAKPA